MAEPVVYLTPFKIEVPAPVAINFPTDDGPPFSTRVAVLGGHPHVLYDHVVCAILIGLFLSLAVKHMYYFKKNKRQGHFFIWSAVIFGFCMSRISTFSLRLVWGLCVQNVNLEVASTIFLSAGVLLLYLTNLVFAQRILREYHPMTGKKPVINRVFLISFMSLLIVFFIVLISTVLTYFTMDLNRLRICRNIQRFTHVYLMIFSLAPIPIVLLSRGVTSSGEKVNFGKLGPLKGNVQIVLAAAVLLTMESIFRAGVVLSPTRAPTDPAWYHKRVVMYIFVPMVEVLVVILFAVTRVDKRFFVNGKAEKNLAGTKEGSSAEVTG